MLNPDSELQQKFTEYSPYFVDIFGRLYKITIIFCIGFIVGFISAAPILTSVTHFFNFKDVVLVASSPFQIVNLAMDTGFFCAGLIAIPYGLYHFYSFIMGGLKNKEKKIAFTLLPLIVLLFCFGFAYSFSILYLAMQTLANLNVNLGITNMWNISIFLAQLISTSAWLGLIFEFPVVITFCVKLNMLNLTFLREKRRHAIFGMFVLTSLLPPTDGISLLLMVLPLIVMYEATIIYNRIGTRQLIASL